MSHESKRRGRKKQKRLQKAREAARLLGARSTTGVCSVCGIFRTMHVKPCVGDKLE